MTDGRGDIPDSEPGWQVNDIIGVFQQIADLLFPQKCMFCREISESVVCGKCRGSLPYYSGATDRREFFSKCTAAFRYEGAVREAILRLKFGNYENYAVGFGHFMAEAAKRELEGFDIATWVPLSKRRRRKRGYDQARLLAEETAKSLGVPAVKALDKVRETGRQSDLRGKAKRAANVMGAYRAVPGTVKGLRVLLVDDVVTTGATLSECARELLMAGAEEVVCVCAACAEED